MMFTTPEFIFLLIVTFSLYYMLPKGRIWILTFANFLFYSVIGYGFCLLFAVVSLITYASGLGIGRVGKYGPKIILFLVIAINLGNLFFFKYTTYVFRLLEKFLSVSLISDDSILLHIVLPLGISFYTFELISYIVDVYKQKIEPEKSLLRFWIFIMFFAHMIAGPIMRGKEFLPQLGRLHTIPFAMSNMRLGMLYISLGMFKKICVSDYLSPYVDSLFASPYLSGLDYWLASILFAFQIYCDFSGYSEIAVGIGYLFGLELSLNFRTPYISTNPGEFWRRWHITLSSWIRDYIYIPLGGSKAGKYRSNLNLLIAMGLSGLWHGAATTFIVWGLYYGVLGIAHRYYSLLADRIGLKALRLSWVYRIVVTCCFFGLTCIGWVLFRVEGLGAALAFIKKMIVIDSFVISKSMSVFWLIALGLGVLHVLEYLFFKNLPAISARWHKFFPAPIRAIVYVSIVLGLVMFLKVEQNSFIYFQF